MTPYDVFEKLRPCKEIIANEIDIEFDSILEVGAQYGENLLALERKFPGKKIMGVDIDMVVTSEGQKYLEKSVLTYGDIRGLSFPNKSFDIVFTNALFCMLKEKDIEKALKELKRVAVKQLIFVELLTDKAIGEVPGGRTALNWNKHFKGSIIRKITEQEWDVDPWKTYGYLIKVKL